MNISDIVLERLPYINLKSYRHGWYVVAEPSGKMMCDRKEASLWEQFKVERCPTDPKAIILKSAHGNYVTVPTLKKVICVEPDPNKATPMYPVTNTGYGSDVICFKMQNNKYLSAQKDKTLEWNRDKVFGFESFYCTIREVIRYVSFTSYNKKLVSAHNDVKCSFGLLCTVGLFSVSNNGGVATITTCDSGKILALDPKTNCIALSETGGETTVFNYVRIDVDFVALKASNNKFVTVEADGTLRASADGINEHEVFKITPVYF